MAKRRNREGHVKNIQDRQDAELQVKKRYKDVAVREGRVSRRATKLTVSKNKVAAILSPKSLRTVPSRLAGLKRRAADKLYTLACEYCGLLQADKGELQQHEKTHYRLAPDNAYYNFRCSLCNELFTTTQIIKSHHVNVHSGACFHCLVDGCDCSFESKKLVIEHHWETHPRSAPLKTPVPASLNADGDVTNPQTDVTSPGAISQKNTKRVAIISSSSVKAVGKSDMPASPHHVSSPESSLCKKDRRGKKGPNNDDENAEKSGNVVTETPSPEETVVTEVGLTNSGTQIKVTDVVENQSVHSGDKKGTSCNIM